MLGDFTTCTAIFGNGARIGMVIIHKKTWLTRQDQKMVNSVCCVAVPGTIFLCFAARRTVSGLSLLTVTTTSGCVSVSAWTDLHFVLCSFLLSSLLRAKRGKIWASCFGEKTSNRMGKGQG